MSDTRPEKGQRSMEQIDSATTLRHSVAGLLHGKENVTWTCIGECYEAADAVLAYLRSLPVEQRMAALGMIPAMSRPPADCSDDCMDGPCTCSGNWIVMAWAPENDAPIRPIADRVRMENRDGA